MKKFNNVKSLTSFKAEKMAKAIAYPRGSLNVDFKDITRLQRRGEDGTLLAALTDPVELGASAYVQVRQIFWRHGLERMPDTWGELLGNLSYCQLLNMRMVRFTGDTAKDAALAASHEAREPGRGELLTLFARDDLPAVAALHVAQKRFERNATDPMLTKTLSAGSSARQSPA